MAQDPQGEEWAKQWGQVVARAWSDEAYKQRLLSDPQVVLAEAGLPVPANLQVQVHEVPPTLLHLVLPPPLTDLLSDEQLDAVSGAAYAAIDGSDLVNQQTMLQPPSVEMANRDPTQAAAGIEAALATWAAIANSRTQMLRHVADALRIIGRNVN